tara:strand:- start:4 stop:282 length:279 start_codon:yes stop_codon:yes gene_type:complete
MSKVIKVLEKMACDVSLVDEENITTFLANADINNDQQHAISAKNIEQLTETINDLPKIISYSQVLPDEDNDPDSDEQEDDNQSTSQLLTKIL